MFCVCFEIRTQDIRQTFRLFHLTKIQDFSGPSVEITKNLSSLDVEACINYYFVYILIERNSHKYFSELYSLQTDVRTKNVQAISRSYYCKKIRM